MNRILRIDNYQTACRELQKIGVSTQGIVAMADKALGCSVKLCGVKVGAANILKQEMLSIGGDAAVARGVVNGSEEVSDLILLGNANKLKKLIKKLHNQTIFGLPEIREDLQKMRQQLLDKNSYRLDCAGKTLLLDSTKIMGILNVTPDSFSDGNKYFRVESAVEKAREMIAAGADILDIGGESTRPGAPPVSTAEEIKRVVPIIEQIRRFSDLIISVDTSKAAVAEAAILAGANIINDISALQADQQMVEILKKYDNIPIILMHMQGTPQNMQDNPFYQDVVNEILLFLNDRINFCLAHQIDRQRIIVDPGLGFGKRYVDNLQILQRLEEFRSLQVPILLGASRKSFIKKIYDSTPQEREEATLATTALAFQHKIEMVRVHRVEANKKILQTLQAIKEA
ncbi:MAG: dihydropteroate synthase [Candidatus Cloacimonadales bacterium]